MAETFDKVSKRLREQGWGWTMRTIGTDKVRIDLECDTSKLKANIPRPSGEGRTVLEALQAAMLNGGKLIQ